MHTSQVGGERYTGDRVTRLRAPPQVSFELCFSLPHETVGRPSGAISSARARFAYLTQQAPVLRLLVEANISRTGCRGYVHTRDSCGASLTKGFSVTKIGIILGSTR